MHQLLLLRHAKSARDDPELSDHARPLSARGQRAAAAMRDLGLQPDIVLASSARRAVATLEALEPWDETPLVETMDTLYMAAAPQMLKVLQGLAETVRSVLLLGHNPGMHELALLLAGSHEAAALGSGERSRLAEGFPAAALAEFALPGQWRSLGTGGARLHRFLVPRDLPEMAA